MIEVSTTWWTILGCAVVTAVIKAAGPVALGGRTLPLRVGRVVSLLAPALLTALVVTSALADGQRVHVGADTAGVLAAGGLLLLRVPLLVCVLVAVLVTAGLRFTGLLT